MELLMNSATIEQKIDNDCNDDVLSLRDLQMYDQSSTHSSPKTFSGQELFEFFPTLSNPTATGDIMFFGKVIPDSVDDEELNDRYQNRDYLRGVVGSSSFRLPERPIDHVIPLRSVSNRGLGSPRQFSTSVKKVALTSKSKRRMFMFGPVKFMPEIEMSSIRERQGRRAPSRMFPMAEGGGARKSVAGTHKNTVSCRARLNSVFERSVACLRI